MANNTTTIGAAEHLGIPVIDPIISFTTQILCLAAAVAASAHTVKRWTAVKTLTPPELVPIEQSADAAPAPKGLKKVLNKKFLARLVGPLIGLSVYIFFVFGIKMIKNRTVINSFWVGFMVFACWAAFETSTASLVHPASTVSLIPLKLIPGYQLKFEPQPRSKLWTLGAAGASIACAVSFYFGYQLAAPIMAAAWTFTLISTFVVHRITARHMMMIVNGYLITCITLGAIVGAVVTLFESSKHASSTPSEPKTDTTVNPSMWVMEYMTTWSSAFPTWMPGFMLALAMRFDHSRSLSQDTVVTKTTPGASAAIPRSVASFACPTFKAGFFALALSVAALKIFTQLSFPIAGTVVEMMFILVTVPATTLGLVFGAWKQGQLKAWWLYEETWVPTVKKDEDAAKSDAEATPADETDDEKMTLLQPSK